MGKTSPCLSDTPQVFKSGRYLTIPNYNRISAAILRLSFLNTLAIASLRIYISLMSLVLGSSLIYVRS